MHNTNPPFPQNQAGRRFLIKMRLERINVVLIVLLVVLRGTLIEGKEQEDKYDYGYVSGTVKGPERWGFLNPKWVICSNGTMQSPVNLPSSQPQPAQSSERIVYVYKLADATLKNRGHDIEVKWAKTVSKIKINGVEYFLKQLHWHTPSEHTISGTRYAMEMHIVHKNSENKTAVVAILYQLGKPDPFLSKLSDKIRSISNNTEEVEVGGLNPSQLISGRGATYYRYMGSFSTPPCTEGVIWTIDTKIGTVSQEQINLLQQAVEDHAAQNARPQQPLNGRKINLYFSHP